MRVIEKKKRFDAFNISFSFAHLLSRSFKFLTTSICFFQKSLWIFIWKQFWIQTVYLALHKCCERKRRKLFKLIMTCNTTSMIRCNCCSYCNVFPVYRHVPYASLLLHYFLLRCSILENSRLPLCIFLYCFFIFIYFYFLQYAYW